VAEVEQFMNSIGSLAGIWQLIAVQTFIGAADLKKMGAPAQGLAPPQGGPPRKPGEISAPTGFRHVNHMGGHP
jgi:hypothetical protein